MKIEWTITIDGKRHENAVEITASPPPEKDIESGCQLVMMLVGEYLSMELLGVERGEFGLPVHGSRLMTSLVSREDHARRIEALKAASG